jgi:hypothetical protein
MNLGSENLIMFMYMTKWRSNCRLNPESVSWEQTEALQRAMARKFGADLAATDSTRMLRLPKAAGVNFVSVRARLTYGRL